MANEEVDHWHNTLYEVDNTFKLISQFAAKWRKWTWIPKIPSKSARPPGEFLTRILETKHSAQNKNLYKIRTINRNPSVFVLALFEDDDVHLYEFQIWGICILLLEGNKRPASQNECFRSTFQTTQPLQGATSPWRNISTSQVRENQFFWGTVSK